MTDNNKKPKCKVLRGKNSSSQIETMSEEEASKINPDNYDFYRDEGRMETHVKRKNGKTTKFNGKLEKVDGRPLGLLKKLMMRPGRFLIPYEIGNTGEYCESYFIKDNIVQYVSKLRKHLFVENGFEIIKTTSRPYKVALNGDISFCWIEPFIDDSDEPVLE